MTINCNPTVSDRLILSPRVYCQCPSSLTPCIQVTQKNLLLPQNKYIEQVH